MRKIFVSQNLMEVEMLKDRLDQVGIPCTIKNQRASSLAGEVPFAEVFPELWVLRDEHYERARELLEEQPVVGEKGSPWICSGCGEQHSSEFTACWKCGREKRSDSKPSPTWPRTSAETPDSSSRIPDSVKGFVLGAIVALGGLALWNYVSLEGTSADRNGDGRTDEIYTYDRSVLRSAKLDNDFDGFFETLYTYNRNGLPVRGEIDRNKDGKPDLIEQYIFGKYSYLEFLDGDTGNVRKRAFFKLGKKTHEEIDQDGDGKFERTVRFDELENPID